MTRINFPDRSPPPQQPAKRKGRRLPQKSEKRKKLMAIVGPQRRARKEQIGRCMICGKQTSQLDADEIARGYSREFCLEHPELTLISCWKCHKRSQNWPIEKRIAALVLFEIESKCATYNELRGTAPTHVTAEGVIGYLMFRKRKP